MPFIVTTIHNPAALRAVCRQLELAPPGQRCVRHQGRQIAGWLVRLPGVNCPIICDTLTGLIGYDSKDNAFEPYARVMRFVYRCYAAQAQLRSQEKATNRKPNARLSRRPVLAG